MKASTVFLSLAAIAQAHFILTIPEPISFDEDTQTVGPCGGANPASRINVSKFKVKGSPIGLITTHDHAEWQFNIALLSDLSTWIPVTPALHQTGLGEFCEPQIPARKKWAGKKAVLQVVQVGHDGNLYAVSWTSFLGPPFGPLPQPPVERLEADSIPKCAAIKIAQGGPASVPAGCVNATGISAEWE